MLRSAAGGADTPPVAIGSDSTELVGHRHAGALPAIALSVAVAVAAVWASLGGAISLSLWGDEVASARVLSEPSLSDALDRIARTESTPPAWYVLAWAASRIDERVTGDALSTPVERLRLLSVLFAALASVLTSLLALRLLGDRVLALVSGCLVALGSAPATHAEELRAYALLTLVSAAFGLLLVRVAATKGAWSWVGLAFLVALGTLTHYFFFLTVAAGIVWLWLSRPRPAHARAAAAAIAVGAVAFLPWTLLFVDQVQHRRYAWIGKFDAGAVAVLPSSLFFHPEGMLFTGARIALTICLVIGAVTLWRTAEGKAVVALSILPIAAAAAIWAFGQPIFDARNLLGVAPFLAIVAAAALTRLPRRLVAPVAMFGLLITITAALLTGATYGRVDHRRIAEILVDMGWRDVDPVAVAVPTGATSLRIAVSWYLPTRPALRRAHSPGQDCPRFFVIAHSTTLGPWLQRGRARVDAMRRLASYDHPAAGRRNGAILVARLHGAIDTPGDLYVVRGRPARCVS